MKNRMDGLLIKMALLKDRTMEKMQERVSGEGHYVAAIVTTVIAVLIAGGLYAAYKTVTSTATTGMEGLVKNLFDNILK